MRLAVTEDNFDDITCFSMNGYAVQTQIFNNEKHYKNLKWVNSQWMAYDSQEAVCAATNDEKQDIAPGIECFINYGSLKPSPCRCGFCPTTPRIPSLP